MTTAISVIKRRFSHEKDRKDFKLFGLFVLCIFLARVASAAEIKIALDSPPDLEKSGTYVWAKTFGDILQANGLKVKEFPRDALGGEEEKLDQVSQGLLEVSMSDLAKAGQLNPTIFGFHLPYIFDSVAHLDRVIDKTDLMAKVNAGTTKKGVRVLALVTVGGFNGMANTKRPVKTPEDLKGLRIRAMDKAQAQYLEAWGASTVIVPWAEIYSALQTGVADGYLNAAIVPILFKHTEVLKYYSDIKYSAPLRVGICSETWYQGLSQKERAIVNDAVAKANTANRNWQANIEKSGLEQLKTTGMKIHMSTSEERAQFAKPVRPVYFKVISEEIAKAFIAAADSNR